MKITKFFALLCAAATLSVVGCETNNGTDEPDNSGGNKPGKETIELDAKRTVTTGEEVVFTVKTASGEDVTAESKIHLKADGSVVENPFVSEVDGKFEFYATYGTKISKVITVSVVPEIPTLPEDDQPENLAFNHHVLLVDHTGTDCGFCPNMMAAINEVAAMPGYHEKFYEAMAHTYNTDDPAYSHAAEIVKSHYRSLINGYPTTTFNFYHPTPASYYADDVKSQIDALWKADGADAGVAASVTGGNTMVVVSASVKAKVAGDYCITAWLLEDGIYAVQNGTKDERYYTHNNAVRSLASTDRIYGFSLGTIEAGQSKSYEMTMDINTNAGWKPENLKVLVIASALNKSKRYEVVNMTVCPVNQSVNYDYKK